MIVPNAGTLGPATRSCRAELSMGVLVGKIPLKLRQRAPLVPPGGSVTASPLKSASFLANLQSRKILFTNQHRTSRTGGDCAEKLVPHAQRGLGGRRATLRPLSASLRTGVSTVEFDFRNQKL